MEGRVFECKRTNGKASLLPGLADGPPIHRMDFFTFTLGPKEVTLQDFNLIDCVDRKLEVAQHVIGYPCGY